VRRRFGRGHDAVGGGACKGRLAVRGRRERAGCARGWSSGRGRRRLRRCRRGAGGGEGASGGRG
jgi:hypothetical protein